MDFFKTDKSKALEAKENAQWIAFGPVIFQVARCLRNLGILALVEEAGEQGISLEDIAQKRSLSLYGVRVLLESGLSMGLVVVNNHLYSITKTAHFILHDPLTRVNMDFVHDVCYKGLFHLEESILTGRAAGMKELGNWPTIYEGVSKLPDHIQKSWFAFDHFFSDDAFPKVLPYVYRHPVHNLLDIGGNTGKWAIASAGYKQDLHITIMDLPGPLQVAGELIAQKGLSDRISLYPRNVLDENQPFPGGFDAIWMSQFLDCFSEDQIISILKKCHGALQDNGCVFILEPFWDRQKFEAAAFCLQQTSIYFTALANGNSQMYSAETFLPCIQKAGFEVVEQKDHIGLSQTLLRCRKRKLG